MLTDRIDSELLAACPDLRAIANYAVGTDNIDLAATAERGIAVGNTPGVLTETTADLAFALILACDRFDAQTMGRKAGKGLREARDLRDSFKGTLDPPKKVQAERPAEVKPGPAIAPKPEPNRSERPRPRARRRGPPSIPGGHGGCFR